MIPTIPVELQAICLRCLEKDPDHRYQDVAALEKALAACDCADEWTAEKAEEWWATHEANAVPVESP